MIHRAHSGMLGCNINIIAHVIGRHYVWFSWSIQFTCCVRVNVKALVGNPIGNPFLGIACKHACEHA